MQLSTSVLFAFLLVAPAFVVTQNNDTTATAEAPAVTTAAPAPATTAATTAAPEAAETSAATTEAPVTTENVTEADNANTTAATESTTVLPTTQPPVPQPMVPKGVTQECLDHYHGCINESAPDNMNNKMYCDAFQMSKMCIQDANMTAGSNPCTAEEQQRLELLDCGLKTLMSGNTSNILDVCVSRVTECLSQAPQAKDIKDASSFKTQLCKVADDSETCFKTEDGGSVCTEDEYKSILDTAECSSGAVFLSSALLVALAYLVQCAVNGF